MSEKMKNGKIFIVDDDKLSIEILKISLEKYDFEINSFINPIEAYKAITSDERFNCECLILDLNMPQLDGFQFIQKLKREYPKKVIPIIISSANQDINSIKKALDLGAYDYFTKPLSRDELEVMLPKKVKNAVVFYRTQQELIVQNEKMSKDLNLANQFILKIFPHNKIKNHDFYLKYIPYNEIGGDFIDLIETKDGFIIIIADISGHGVSAALLAYFLKFEFQKYFSNNDDLLKFIYHLNSEFINIFEDSFFSTVFIASYNRRERRLIYVNAGHPPPIVCVNERPVFLKSTGTFVGMIEYPIYKISEIVVGNSCPLICYTDGMYEFWLEGRNEIFGFNRFYKLLHCIYFKLKKEKRLNLNNFVEYCFSSLKFYSKGNYNDDLLMFMIEL
ncbi:MAG: SpoIIE family protein phosphatase [Spirochaetales bacterium]|nr:SpoIIE family protein phosphatase [Spirochaetales bacterium]